MSRTTLKACAAGSTIFRLVKRGDQHYPPNATKPLPAAFRPTDSDLEEGRKRSVPVVFSTWETSETLVADALRMRGHATLAIYQPFALKVESVRKIDAVAAGQKLDVVSDPRPVWDGPGAWGHSGVVGLVDGHERATKKDKVGKEREKNAQRLLADLPSIYDDAQRDPPHWTESYKRRVASGAAFVYSSGLTIVTWARGTGEQ